jgi:CRP-like cAMP-binding protein
LCIRALEPSVVCRVGRQDLEALVRANPEVGLALARMLVTRVMLLEDRWADMAERRRGSQARRRRRRGTVN